MGNNRFCGSVFAAVVVSASAALAAITGTVTDKDNSQPVANAVVRMAGTATTTTTDAQGQFTLGSGGTGTIANGQAKSVLFVVSVKGNALLLSGLDHNGMVNVDVFNAAGVRISHAAKAAEAGQGLEVGSLWQTPGLYMVKIRCGDKVRVVKCVGTTLGNMSIAASGVNDKSSGQLAKKLSSVTIEVSKDTAYLSKRVMVSGDPGDAGTIAIKKMHLSRALVMKDVPAQTFIMGQAGITPTTHSVTLSAAYSIQETDVTEEQYRAVMGTNPSQTVGDLYPVENLTWCEAVEFCNALSKLSGLDTVYTYTGVMKGTVWLWPNQVHDTCFVNPANDFSKNGYRLPTEAQWECACRGGTTTSHWWGSANKDSYCWSADNSGGVVHQVGLLAPNPYGLYDITGNVWQYCNDWYDPYYVFPSTDPMGASSGQWRVVRGGTWATNNNGNDLTCASRGAWVQDIAPMLLGFRVALPM